MLSIIQRVHKWLTDTTIIGAVHETVKIRAANTGGDENIKGTHAYNLAKVRTVTFSKLLLLISNLKMNSAFSKFQLRLGGAFPREEYEE